jgi:hypothetical protein
VSVHPPQPVCANGHPVTPSARFCRVCGVPVVAADRPPVQPPPRPPGAPSGTNRAKRRAAASALAVIAVIGVATAVFWFGRTAHSAGQAGAATTAAASAQPATTAPSAEFSTVPPEQAPATVPVRVGLVDISAAAGDPRAEAVGRTLADYFGGINAHDYQRTLSALDPTGPVNPRDPGQAKRFVAGLQTSADSDVVVTAVRDNPAVPRGALADVAFTSRQDPRYGPDREPCTRWSLTYTFTGTDDGRLLIRKTTGSHAPC